MKHAQMDSFAYAELAELNRDVVRNFPAQIAPVGGQISILDQWFDQSAGRAGEDAPLFLVSASLEMRASETGDSASVHAKTSTPTKRSRSKRGPGRPRKLGRPPKAKPDARLAVSAGPLTMVERRDISDGATFMDDMDRGVTCLVDIHLKWLDTYPTGELRDWFRTGPLRAMSEFFTRTKDEAGRPLGWYSIAVRENYEGDRREHLHVMCHCPECHQEALEKMLRRRFPGEQRVFKVGTPEPGWLNYRMKQSGKGTTGKPRPGRATPEVKSRHDGAPVADVHGKRYFMSRSVDLAARQHAGWQEDRDEWRKARNAAMRARDREAQDRGEVSAYG